jgi:excisionase family DNA binding protein
VSALATFSHDRVRRARPGISAPGRRTSRTDPAMSTRARLAIPDGPTPSTPVERSFTPLIDAHAASKLLGVPHTWLLAQARERRIPHHRLGHYVRFNPEDLQQWLKETRSMPGERHRYGRP